MGCASTRVAVAVVGDVTQHKKVNDLKMLARLSGNKGGSDEDTDMDNVKEVLAGTTGQPSNRFEVLHGLQPDQLLVVIKGDNVDSSLRDMAQKKYIKMYLKLFIFTVPSAHQVQQCFEMFLPVLSSAAEEE
ncbi:uncharacterized protein LOC144859476 isoform X2 [Branchiostoma floridae x Branchiostoma japonicum]